MKKQTETTALESSSSGRHGRGWPLALAALLTLAAFAPVAALASKESLPPVEKVLDKYVEATGGLEAYKKVENRVVKATLDIAGQGISLDLTIWVAKPDKSYTAIESEMIGKMEKGTLGDVAWETSMMTGPRILEGSEAALARYGAILDVMAHWRDNFVKYELTGAENVGERPCYKVHLVSNEGIEQTAFFDSESGLLVKMEMVVETPMGNVPMESFAAWR